MKPPLVLVTGMPASGKTTLSQLLAQRLFLPLVAKDQIKESLARVRPGDSELGPRTFEVLHAVTERYLDLGAGVVLEAAFVRGISETEVRQHLARSTAVDVHCIVDAALAGRRFEDRAGTPERHRCHPDLAILGRDPIETWPDRYGRMELGIPVLEVDTTDGYEPSVEAIVSWVEERI